MFLRGCAKRGRLRGTGRGKRRKWERERWGRKSQGENGCEERETGQEMGVYMYVCLSVYAGAYKGVCNYICMCIYMSVCIDKGEGLYVS